MSGEEKYRFSFTAVSAPVADFVRLAQMIVDVGYDTEQLNRDNLGKEKERTNQRHFQEMKMRFKNLTRDEIDLLVTGDMDDKKQVVLIAMCKSYRFIFDFVLEVVRDKILVYDTELKDLDYNSFVNRKIYDHPEYEELSETTRKKIKQVLYLILEQVGLIDSAKNKRIQPQLVSSKMMNIAAADNPELLKLFLKSDREIADYINENR